MIPRMINGSMIPPENGRTSPSSKNTLRGAFYYRIPIIASVFRCN
jgi:hypothetical protein